MRGVAGEGVSNTRIVGLLLIDLHRLVRGYCRTFSHTHILHFGLMSKISSSPGVVVANTHSVGASLAVWLASGLLGWTGASSFAELGSSIPVNGGAQAYLQYAYGPLVSYLFAWTAISALKPGVFTVASQGNCSA